MEVDLEAYRLATAVSPAALDAIDNAAAPVVVAPADYSSGRTIPPHWHRRGQLMFALSGVMLVSTPKGRWIVPDGHALWMPALMVHEVDMLGAVRLRSAYVTPDARPGLPADIRVVAMTPLLRELMTAAVAIAPGVPSPRDRLVLDLILEEIPALEQRPLALPLPADPRLAALCRRFLEHPAAHASIDDWADAAGMSRRSFTRHFQKETGLSLTRWRQQATLFAALPRLSAGQAVTTVALDLGYDSVAAFTTMFRRMLGASPRAWTAAGK